MNPNCPKPHQYAPVAQWIEQWIPNPCAASSILAGGTKIFNPLRKLHFLSFESPIMGVHFLQAVA